MRGYLIEKYSDMKSAYTVNRIVEEATKAEITLDVVGVADCCIWENKVYHKNIPLEERDFVINRYKYGIIVDKINALCKRAYNSNEAFKYYVNKYNQLEKLELKECLTPCFLLANVEYDYQSIVSRVGSPFIVKGLESSQGREIYFIHSAEEYINLQKTINPRDELLFEEFIEESKGKDLRIYSIRGKATACMLRSNDQDFRANVARGAYVKMYPANEKIQAVTQEIYEKTGLDFLGIDLLFGKEAYYICEINVMAGIEGIERATGTNIAGMIIDTIRRDFDEY